MNETQGNGILPFVIGSLSDNTNQENKTFYEKLKKEHIDDGGKHPDAYAMTELIRQTIIDKTYKQYNGGGCEYRTETRIQNFDVVVWFNFGGDAFFQICMDNSEGDYCVLYNSNDQCEFIKKVL